MHASLLVLLGWLTVTRALAPEPSVSGASEVPEQASPPPPTPLESACAALEASAAQRFARIKPRFDHEYGEDGIEAFLYPMRRCVPAGRGAWFLEGRLSRRFVNDGQMLDGTMTPLHVAEDGKVLRATTKFDIDFQSMIEEPGETRFRIMPMMDYDRDGVSELILFELSSALDLYEETYTVFTVRDGRIRVYPGLEKVKVSSIGDYDRDGLIDVVTSESSPWNASNCFGMDTSSPTGLPPILYHARPDGTFSSSDEIAAAYLREQHCKAPPSTLISPEDYDWEMNTMNAIACARIWGASAKEVQQRLRREWGKVKAARRAPDYQDCGHPLAYFERIARIEPPVVLEAP